MKKNWSHLRYSHHMYSIKKVLLRISQYSQENTCVGTTQLFSCEYYKIFKTTFFEEHLRTAVSATWKILQMKMNKVSFDSRSSHQRCSIKKGALKNFAKFTGKHLCQSLFFNKGCRPKTGNFIEKETMTQLFSVNFVKFSRTYILQKSSGWMLMWFWQFCVTEMWLFTLLRMLQQ